MCCNNLSNFPCFRCPLQYDRRIPVVAHCPPAIGAVGKTCSPDFRHALHYSPANRDVSPRPTYTPEYQSPGFASQPSTTSVRLLFFYFIIIFILILLYEIAEPIFRAGGCYSTSWRQNCGCIRGDGGKVSSCRAPT